MKAKEAAEKGISAEDANNDDSATDSPSRMFGNTKTEDYKSIATEGLQAWWASHLEAWEQEHKASFTEAQAQAIADACKARSYFV